MSLEIEQRLGELYQQLRQRSPAYIDWKVICHPDMLKQTGWQEGDLVTDYKIPVQSDLRIKEITINDSVSQSDIWIIGKPRKTRKFRHYSRT